MTNDDKLYINGIDGDTGQYLAGPLSADQLAAFIKDELPSPRTINWLKNVWQKFKGKFLGLPFDVDPTDLHQTGWAVVFHQDEDANVKKALAPLIERRRQQVGDDTKFKILEYQDTDGEDYARWLVHHGVGKDIVLTKVPYYLLVVGSPARIPFRFCHNLDVEYAVGRLHFDKIGDYETYAASVLEYEKLNSTVPNGKEVVYFATRHDFDKATQLSADLLVNPLADGTLAAGGQPNEEPIATQMGFRQRKFWGSAATKGALAEVLAPGPGVRPPALLFTATHGMGWRQANNKQKTDQGALVCQDWPGFGSIDVSHYFAAADLQTLTARVHGLIAFHFACYGAGTPKSDRFYHKPGQPPPEIAAESFLAALPKALLAHPQGGALAVIGHVERAWSYSFYDLEAGSQRLPFRNALGRILRGEPVGHALKSFSERYARLAIDLSEKLEQGGFGVPVTDQDLAGIWTERNDAQGYTMIGDPAVRLRVNDLV